MNREKGLEEALLEFTNLVVPGALELPKTVLHPTSVTEVATPFLTLLALNCLSLAVFTLLGKLLVRVIDLSLGGLNWALSRSIGGLVRAAWSRLKLPYQADSFTREHRASKKTKIVEDADEFADWEEVIRESVRSGSRPNLSPEAIEALAILGVSSCSSEAEIRKAYLSLMKLYHPDLFMNSPKTHQEMMGQRVVRIREAYDTITRELHQIN